MGGVARREFLRWIGGGAASVAVGVPFLRNNTGRIARQPDWCLSDEFLSSLDDRLAAAGIPGVAIGLTTADGPATLHAAGRVAGPGSVAVATDTVFLAASLSKPVVATVALTLHASGDFDLDRPVSTYLSDDLPRGDGAEIVTPRLCLAHASGLPNWRFAVEPLVLAFTPGERWRYSGEGYVLVQRALERETGRGIERLAREIVFEPLGMASTSYLALPRLAARFAPPFIAPDERFADYAALLAWKERAVMRYAADVGRDPADLGQDELRRIDAEIDRRAAEMARREFPETAPVPNFVVPNAAGSLRTTAGDYVRFVAHWLRSGGLRSSGFAEPILRDDGLAWGVGWGLEGPSGGRDAAFWHWGETLGVRTLAYADPVRGGALVVLTNGEGGMQVAKATFEDVAGPTSPVLAAL